MFVKPVLHKLLLLLFLSSSTVVEGVADDHESSTERDTASVNATVGQHVALTSGTAFKLWDLLTRRALGVFFRAEGRSAKIIDGCAYWYLRHFGTRGMRFNYAAATTLRTVGQIAAKSDRIRVVTATVTALFGYWHYKKNQKALREEERRRAEAEVNRILDMNGGTVAAENAADLLVQTPEMMKLRLNGLRFALLEACKVTLYVNVTKDDPFDWTGGAGAAGNWNTVNPTSHKAKCGMYERAPLKWYNFDGLLKDMEELHVEVPDLSTEPEPEPEFADPAGDDIE